MNCIIKNKQAGLILSKQGIQYESNFFETDYFKKEFGDWTNGEVIGKDRVYEDGSPRIYFNRKNTNAFYKDKDGILRPIFNVKFQTLPPEVRTEISHGFVNQLVADLFVTKDFIGKDIDEVLNINFDVQKFVQDKFEYYISLGVTPEVESSLLESQDDYVDLLIRRLKNLGLSYDKGRTELDEYGNEAIVQAPSFQRNTKDKATVRVKFLLNSLTNPNEDFEFAGNAMSAMPKAISQAQVWAVVLPILSNIPSIEGKPPIDQQLDALYKAKDTYPWLEGIINVLKVYKEEGDLQGQIEFFNAFNNIKNKLNVTQFSTKGVEHSYTTMSAEESNRDYKFVLKELLLDYRQKYFPGDEKNKADFKELERVVEKVLIDIDKMYRLPRAAYAEGNFDVRIEELADIVEPFFDMIGITTSKELMASAVGHWKDKNRSTTADYLSKVQALSGYIGTLESKIKNFIRAGAEDLLIAKNNPFARHFEEIAKAEEDLRSDLSMHMVTLGKNRVYVYSLPTMIQERLNELKSGEIDLNQFVEDFPWLENSLFLSEWAANPDKLSDTDIGLRGVLQRKGQSRNAKDGGDITKGDYTKVDFFNVLRKNKSRSGVFTNKPIYNTQVPADKSREYQISTDVFIDATRLQNIHTRFMGYVYDEISEMLNAKKDIRKAITDAGGDFEQVINNPKEFPAILENASQDLTMIYHLSKNGNIFEDGKFAGQAFTFKVFEDLNKLKIPLFINGVLNIDSLEEAKVALDNNAVYDTINDGFKAEIEAWKDIMQTLKLGVRLSANKKSIIGTVDATALEYYKNKAIENGKTSTIEQAKEIDNLMAKDYIVNSTMSKIEFSKIFTGSLQYYKNNSDYIKRVPSTYIDGIQLLTGITPGDELFTQFTFKTESFKSDLYDELPDNIKEYYSKVDRTDAQGYITPKRWKFIMERSGKLSKAQLAIYNKMKAQWRAIEQGVRIGEDIKLTSDEIKLLSAQPIKGVYYKNDPEIGPVYLKYSQAILIPSLAESSPKVKALLSYMNSHDIDEAVAESGVKVGAKKPAPLFNYYTDDQGVEVEEFIAPKDAKIHILDNRNWRLQQDLPTKLIKPTKIGTQIQKIIISGLAFLKNDKVKMDNGMTGTELLDNLNNALSNLSNIGVQKALKKYGINEFGHITDLESFYKPVIRDLESKDNSSERLIEALKMQFSLSALPQASRTIISTFMGSMKKGAVDLLMPGGAFIQMSDHLIGKSVINNKGIKMLVDFDGLKPPRVEVINGKATVLPGQAFLPHSLVAKYIPNYQNLSEEELRDSFPEELRTLIGYRIPTQSRASTDLIEIVGILPPEMGDTIITYGEITAKTGSDFDIDKLFFMMQDMHMIGSKLELVKDNEIEIDDFEFRNVESTVNTVVEEEVQGIAGIPQPEIDIPLLSDEEILASDDATEVYIKQTSLKKDKKDLEDLIKCIWG